MNELLIKIVASLYLFLTMAPIFIGRKDKSKRNAALIMIFFLGTIPFILIGLTIPDDWKFFIFFAVMMGSGFSLSALATWLVSDKPFFILHLFRRIKQKLFKR